jgi:hypothetical protein
VDISSISFAISSDADEDSPSPSFTKEGSITLSDSYRLAIRLTFKESKIQGVKLILLKRNTRLQRPFIQPRPRRFVPSLPRVNRPRAAEPHVDEVADRIHRNLQITKDHDFPSASNLEALVIEPINKKLFSSFAPAPSLAPSDFKILLDAFTHTFVRSPTGQAGIVSAYVDDIVIFYQDYIVHHKVPHGPGSDLPPSLLDITTSTIPGTQIGDFRIYSDRKPSYLQTALIKVHDRLTALSPRPPTAFFANYDIDRTIIAGIERHFRRPPLFRDCPIKPANTFTLTPMLAPFTIQEIEDGIRNLDRAFAYPEVQGYLHCARTGRCDLTQREKEELGKEIREAAA